MTEHDLAVFGASVLDWCCDIEGGRATLDSIAGEILADIAVLSGVAGRTDDYGDVVMIDDDIAHAVRNLSVVLHGDPQEDNQP